MHLNPLLIRRGTSTNSLSIRLDWALVEVKEIGLNFSPHFIFINVSFQKIIRPLLP